jgi:N-acetylglucosamine kinase-like BadF-type ATPase
MSSQSSYLGLDSGGTQTRWALADAHGGLLAAGTVVGISGLQLASADGRAVLEDTMEALAAAVRSQATAARPLAGIVAGLTGFAGADSAALQTLLAQPFGLKPAAVQVMTDIELACRAAFAPGQGAVVYAGTGSIAAHIDAAGQMHRAGGRGALIDDAGGGHSIACQALRHLWRMEDAAPGSAAATVLGQQMFQRLGGSDWAQTRRWVYGASRGEIGMLALVVAAAAHAGDAQALALLQRAGVELARLALCLQARLGAMPLVLSGRVFDLHPTIEAALLQELPAELTAHRAAEPAQQAAARLAATQFKP